MPQRDGKGPQGKGPRTGRAMGNCDPKDGNIQKDDNVQKPPRDGRGAGQGRGQGARMRNNS